MPVDNTDVQVCAGNKTDTRISVIEARIYVLSMEHGVRSTDTCIVSPAQPSRHPFLAKLSIAITDTLSHSYPFELMCDWLRCSSEDNLERSLHQACLWQPSGDSG